MSSKLAVLLFVSLVYTSCVSAHGAPPAKQEPGAHGGGVIMILVGVIKRAVSPSAGASPGLTLSCREYEGALLARLLRTARNAINNQTITKEERAQFLRETNKTAKTPLCERQAKELKKEFGL